MLGKQALKNLKIGRDYLANHITDEQFNMKYYMTVIGDRTFGPSITPPCDSIGCALGWMAHAPKLRNSNLQPASCYDDFAERFLGINPDSDMGQFLFSAEYIDIDNTREGAIGRIDAVLKHPDLFNPQSW